MSEYAIEVKNLSKVFYPHIKLKQNIGETIRKIFKKKDAKEVFEVRALNNISFKINKGEVLGIIGQNGSGKSTLLKILSGITEPTSGSVKVNGKLVSILEVGTGFHPELSGRENIYFIAEIYGLITEEIEKKESAIIEFSEIGDFLDMPVKQYSSGMFMRLAFSILVHLDSNIILLDEVFSVGDFKFKEKSESALKELIERNKTVLLVSHDIKTIQKICSRIIVIESGNLIYDGCKSESIYKYIYAENMTGNTLQKEENKQGVDNKNKYKILSRSDKSGYKTEIFDPENVSYINNVFLRCFSEDRSKNIFTHKSLLIELSYNQNRDIEIFPSININYNIVDLCLGLNPLLNFDINDNKLFKNKGKKVFLCRIPENIFNEGTFLLDLVFCKKKSKMLMTYRGVLKFDVLYDENLKIRHNYDGDFKCGLMPKFSWKIEAES